MHERALQTQVVLPLRKLRDGGCRGQVYHSQHATQTSVHPAEGWVQVALSMLRRQLLAASLEAEGRRVQGAGVPFSMQHRPLCILQRDECRLP